RCRTPRRRAPGRLRRVLLPERESPDTRRVEGIPARARGRPRPRVRVGSHRRRDLRPHDPRDDRCRRASLLHQQPADRPGADRPRLDSIACRSHCMKPIALAALLALSIQSASVAAQRPSGSAPLDRLKEAIARTTKSINATWGIYVKSLDTGEEVALDADRQMETMSTIKIPLMIEAFEQIKAGRFKLTDKYTLARDDIRPGTGIIQRLDPGAVLTVKDLLTLMIIVSDNTATDVLYRMVGGPAAVTRRMQALGLKITHPVNTGAEWFAAFRAAPSAEAFYREGKHPYGLSTAREMGTLLEKMER